MTSNLTRFQHYRDVYAGAEGDKTSREKTSALAEFSGALEGLAATVAPIGVQVQVSAWCASAPASGEDASALTSCRVVGSGVNVNSAGYIITNEHVVRNTRQIRVMLTPKSDHSADGLARGSWHPHLLRIMNSLEFIRI
jgi:S1-C subfamily serine protease